MPSRNHFYTTCLRDCSPQTLSQMLLTLQARTLAALCCISVSTAVAFPIKSYPFVQSWQSSWLDHPALPYEGFGGIGGTGTFDGPPQRRGDATPVDPKVAEEMFSKLKSLGSAARS